MSSSLAQEKLDTDFGVKIPELSLDQAIDTRPGTPRRNSSEDSLSRAENGDAVESIEETRDAVRDLAATPKRPQRRLSVYDSDSGRDPEEH